MYVGGAHHWLGGDAIERETLGTLGQGDAFQVAEVAVQVVQLAIWGQFEFEFLTAFELGELLGLFIAGQDLINRSGR